MGHDRTCDFHPFLINLSGKGNVGTKILLDHVKFLVDIFHVVKHKEPCCMPPDNPKCRYHPHLETFSEIRGTNTESAEQSNRFLNRFKHMCNRMAEFKFKAVFLRFVIETSNELIEEQQQQQINLKCKGSNELIATARVYFRGTLYSKFIICCYDAVSKVHFYRVEL